MLTRREAVRAVAGAAASGDGVRLGVHDGDWEEVLDVAAGHGLLPALWPAVADAAPTARGVARGLLLIFRNGLERQQLMRKLQEKIDEINRAYGDLDSLHREIVKAFV